MNLDIGYLNDVKKEHMDTVTEINKFLQCEMEKPTITNESVRQKLMLVISSLADVSSNYDWLIYELLLNNGYSSKKIEAINIGAHMAKNFKKEQEDKISALEKEISELKLQIKEMNK
ncbi:MAG: hypothetical protein ACRCX2_17065 [Paraclostridium sp.]